MVIVFSTDLLHQLGNHADMADSEICQRQVSNVFDNNKRDQRLRNTKQFLRNTYRRNRRKRSKLRYYKNLRRLRYQRKSDDLCTSLSVIDITDMDWIPVRQSNASTDVAEWHHREQVAYWKSRALSLEYENRMLLQHIRNVYAKQTQDYANYISQQQPQQQQELDEGQEDVDNVIDDNCDNKDAVLKEAPREQIGKKRREEMVKLYGENAVKIIGLETAIQLNYDKHIEEYKPKYWPTLPLKLEFN